MDRQGFELRVHGLLADVWRYMDHVLDELKTSRAKEWPSVTIEASSDGAHWVSVWEGVRTVGSEVLTTLSLPLNARWVRVTQRPRPPPSTEPGAQVVGRLVTTPLHDDGRFGAMLCEHANENPVSCRCPPGCYCMSHTCKGRP